MGARVFRDADVLDETLTLDDYKTRDVIASKFANLIEDMALELADRGIAIKRVKDLIERGYEYAMLHSDCLDDEEAK
mgnify:CR=1 FL=1